MVYGPQSKGFGLNTPNYGVFRVTNSGKNVFTIERTGGTDGAQTVYYRTVNGSAVGGTHFTHAAGSVTFAKGESKKTVTVTEKAVTAAFQKAGAAYPATAYSNGDRTYQMEIYRVDGGAIIDGNGNRATRTMAKSSSYTIDRALYSTEQSRVNIAKTASGENGAKIADTTTSQGGSTQKIHFLLNRDNKENYHTSSNLSSYFSGNTLSYLQNTCTNWLYRYEMYAYEQEDCYEHAYMGSKPAAKQHYDLSGKDKAVSGIDGQLWARNFLQPEGQTHKQYCFPDQRTDGKEGSGYPLDANGSTTEINGKRYVTPGVKDPCYLYFSATGASEDIWWINGLTSYALPYDNVEPQLLAIAPMAGGTWYLHARATNSDGVTATAYRSVTIPSSGSSAYAPPELTVSADNSSWAKSRVITVTRSPGSAPTVRLDGAALTVADQGDGLYTGSFPVTCGGCYTVAASDRAGNTGRDSITVYGLVNGDRTVLKVAENGVYGALPALTAEGYHFDGWYTAAEGGVEVKTGAEIGSNYTVYARWTHIAHAGGTATCQKRAVCAVCGAEYGDLSGHAPAAQWSKDESGHWHACQTEGCTEKCDFAAHLPDHPGGATEEYAVLCTVCGYVIQPQLTHTHIFDQEKAEEAYLQKAATCTESAVYYKSCVCGEKGEETFTVGEPLGHIWGEWSVITPATEEAEGVRQRSCQNDPQHIDQQSIPKLPPARPVGPKPAEKPQETPGSGFVDVPEESYFREAVDWAVKNGITTGVDAAHFAPDGICTRGEIVTFIWRSRGSAA